MDFICAVERDGLGFRPFFSALGIKKKSRIPPGCRPPVFPGRDLIVTCKQLADVHCIERFDAINIGVDLRRRLGRLVSCQLLHDNRMDAIEGPCRYEQVRRPCSVNPPALQSARCRIHHTLNQCGFTRLPNAHRAPRARRLRVPTLVLVRCSLQAIAPIRRLSLPASVPLPLQPPPAMQLQVRV